MLERRDHENLSVIIPVFNAENYVAEAVESALAQPETGEVVLAEDNSPDNSLYVCRELADKHEIVNLYQHPDKQNHGAGSTRNLGIDKAQFDLISFLDADDYFLPNRFKKAIEILSSNDSIDGVYEAIEARFENSEQEKAWEEHKRDKITTLNAFIPPDKLFENLVHGYYGYFHGDGLVVKKKLFEKTGYFNKELYVSQDTHMWLRLAAMGKLAAGSIDKPVAVRRVHDANRITNVPKDKFQKIRERLWKLLAEWAAEVGLGTNKTALIHYRLLFHKAFEANFERNSYNNLLSLIKSLIVFSFKNNLKLSLHIWYHFFRHIIKLTFYKKGK